MNEPWDDGRVEISMTLSKGKNIVEERKETTERAPKSPEPGQARVKVSLGVTLNLGQYRSLRSDVSLELPCRTSLESIATVHAFAKGWCEDRINEEIAAWTGEEAVKTLPEEPQARSSKR